MKKEINLDNNNYVYHGTTEIFDTINLKKCKPWKDFGQGFYTTKNFTQAKSFAKKKYNEIKNIDDNKSAYVLVFEQIRNDLNVYEFDSKNDDSMRLWFKSIFAFRNNYIEFIKDEVLTADVIVGKIADDGTREILSSFDLEDYNDTYIIDRNIKKCLPNKLKTQICFKTKKAINSLKYVGAYNVLEERWM